MTSTVPSPQRSDLIMDFMPFDQAAVGQTIDQFLQQLEDLGAGLSWLQGPTDVVVELLAVAVGLTAWKVVPRILGALRTTTSWRPSTMRPLSMESPACPGAQVRRNHERRSRQSARAVDQGRDGRRGRSLPDLRACPPRHGAAAVDAAVAGQVRLDGRRAVGLGRRARRASATKAGSSATATTCGPTSPG